MKRSTERRFFIGVVLLLLILLSSPVLLFLLIGYGPKVSCRLANLARSDVASEAVAKVLVSGPGTLDFRSLAGEYDRVCLMDGEYDLDPEYESVPHWRKPGAPLATRIGRRICGGWQENSAVFALIKPGSEGDIYALLFHHFEPLPLEAAPSETTPSCMPASEAVVHCFQWRYDRSGRDIGYGIRTCLFKAPK
jgi:hypothetical protein